MWKSRIFRVACGAAILCAAASPQTPPAPQVNQPPGPAPLRSQQPAAPPAAPGQAVSLDLAGALQRARDYNQQFLTAGIAAQLAREDRVQAKAALFPTVSTVSQYLYTQGNGTDTGIFIGNNGVHEYGEQATVHAEILSFAKRADYQRAIAAEAAARARQDIALRGLTAAVVQAYYGLIGAQRHEVNAVRSVDEAARFLDITQRQERGGEAARADVVKAQLQYQQRQRELIDAQTNTQKARVGLGVIVFPNLQQAYDIADDLRPDTPLPPLDEIRGLALANSPELRASEAGLRQARAGIASARAAYIPTLTFDYFYGLDAHEVAIHNPEGARNLGSVAQAGINFPVWNWGATRSKVRQAELQQRQAQVEMTFAQRSLEFNLNAFYLEAQAARSQLASLAGSLDLSVESLRLTLLRYQAGEATALEVVDAQSTLAQARNAYDDGLARFRVALAALQTISGRL